MCNLAYLWYFLSIFFYYYFIDTTSVFLTKRDVYLCLKTMIQFVKIDVKKDQGQHVLNLKLMCNRYINIYSTEKMWCLIATSTSVQLEITDVYMKANIGSTEKYWCLMAVYTTLFLVKSDVYLIFSLECHQFFQVKHTLLRLFES